MVNSEALPGAHFSVQPPPDFRLVVRSGCLPPHIFNVKGLDWDVVSIGSGYVEWIIQEDGRWRA